MRVTVKDVVTEHDFDFIALKKALRVKTGGHDTEISALLKAAIDYMEKAIDTTIGVKRYEVTVDDVMDGPLYELPFGPVVALESTVENVDDGTYTYTYTAGSATTPDDIKRGVMLLCQYWFEMGDFAPTALPGAVKMLISANTRNPMF